MPKMVVSLPVTTSIPTTLRPPHTTVGDHMPTYMPGFMMPLVSRDFPYGANCDDDRIIE